MTSGTYLKLGLLPFFVLLAVGSSSPKKEDSDKQTSDLAAKLAAASSGTTTTTSAATGKVLGNCMKKNGGSCREIYNFALGGESSDKSGCETTGGNYTGGAACAAKDTLIGICTTLSPIDHTTVREKLYYYNEGTNKGVTGAMSKDACAAFTGTWADGPAANANANAKPAGKPAAATAKKK